jgi:hypothetical protein
MENTPRLYGSKKNNFLKERPPEGGLSFMAFSISCIFNIKNSSTNAEVCDATTAAMKHHCRLHQ